MYIEELKATIMNTFDSPLFENDLPEEITALIEWAILHYYNKKNEKLKYVIAKTLLFLERNGHIEIKNQLHSIFHEGMEIQFYGCQRFKKSKRTMVQIDEFNCLDLSTIKDVAIEDKKLIITQYNHTKLIIPFHNEEELKNSYDVISNAIPKRKYDVNMYREDRQMVIEKNEEQFTTDFFTFHRGL